VALADRFDDFWGAKLMARLTPEQIRAAVETGRFSDPRAVDYLTRTLVARQRKTVAYAFGRVAPLDNFSAGLAGDARDGAGNAAVCFDDLAIRNDLAAAANTDYVFSRFDAGGRRLAPPAPVAASSERTCSPAFALDDYEIVEVEVRRPSYAGKLYVHLAPNPYDRGPRVVGLWRI
jgi:hypothetical protein